MIYLGNGMYSDVSLSHGGPWSKHKYIRIENGRYIYPEDVRGRGRGQRAIGAPPPVVGREGHERAKSSRYESEQNYKKADEALRRAVAPKKKLVNPPRPGDVLTWSFGGSDQGPSQAERAKRDHDERNKHRDTRRDYANSHQGPSQAEKAQRNKYGNSRNTENKRNDSVTNQGPSQAEKAQRSGGKPGTSRNVVTRYASKLFRDAVSKQGPSQAEKAQRVNGKPGTSRNVQKYHDPKKLRKKDRKKWSDQWENVPGVDYDYNRRNHR